MTPYGKNFDKTTESKNIALSVVVPAYNEEDVLEEFHRRLLNVLETMSVSFEIVYINDGSNDRTLQIMHDLLEKCPAVVIVNLSRNFGKEIALTAGLDVCIGDSAVVIDADLQDPPELIPELYTTMHQGNDVVYATRISREGESFLKKKTAEYFYKFMQTASRVPIPKDTGDFRIMNRRALDAVHELREQHRFMKGLFSWIGYKQTSLLYNRDPRYAGETKWNYWKLWNFAIEGFTSFSIAPLKMASYVGLIAAFAAFVYMLWVIYKTVIYGDPVAGYPSTIAIILFLGGVQLMSLGVIGEYLGRVFNETKGRPLYFIESISRGSEDDYE